MMVFNKMVLLILMIALFSACNSQQKEKAPGNRATAAVTHNDIYFSCFVNGAVLNDSSDGGIVDPLTTMLLNSGENNDYVVGIRIPTGLKPGQACTACKGFVHKKIVHEGGMIENRIYEVVQDISVTLTSRIKGYAAGKFSFTVKMKQDSETAITVTDGKFGMRVINDD